MSIEILTLVLVAITGFYAWVTFKMLKATQASVAVSQEQLDALSRPYITVRSVVHPGNPTIFLEIENTGKSAALNVNLSLDKDFHAFGKDGKNIREYNLFSHQTDSFPPGGSLLFYLGVGFELFNESSDQTKCPLQFAVQASYQYADKNIVETTPIDLRMHLESALAPDETDKNLKDIATAIKAVKKSVDGASKQLAK